MHLCLFVMWINEVANGWIEWPGGLAQGWPTLLVGQATRHQVGRLGLVRVGLALVGRPRIGSADLAILTSEPHL